MGTAARRTLTLLAIVALVAAGWLGVAGGTYLQHEDPLRHADAIFVLGGTRFERPLEAVDLFKAGYAPFILLSSGLEDPTDEVVRTRGAFVPREVDVVRGAMLQLGVPADRVTGADGSFDNTAAEANYLRSVAVPRHWRTVIVVTSKFHTRRAGFAMRRALRGTGIEVIMRASRYDHVDPAHWWRHRADVRYTISEWEKLVAYRLGLAD